MLTLGRALLLICGGWSRSRRMEGGSKEAWTEGIK